MRAFRLLPLFLFGAVASSWSQFAPIPKTISKQTPLSTSADSATEGASQLLATAAAARAAHDLAGAERAWQQFLADYGNSPTFADQRESILSGLAAVQIAQHEDSAALATIDRYLGAFPKGSAASDLTFWKGYLQYRLEKPEAVETLRAFIKASPNSDRIFEAKRTLGLALRREKKFPEALELFHALAQETDLHRAGEARVLEFTTHIDAGDKAEAAALLQNLFNTDPDLTQIDQIIALQLTALRFGANLLETGDITNALNVLRPLWTEDRLLDAQRARIAALKTEAATNPARADELDTIRAALENDVKNAQTIPDYDGALQLRVAMAYAQLGRPREAALLLSTALPTWKAGPTLPTAALELASCYRDLARWNDLLTAAKQLDGKTPLPPSLDLLCAEAEEHLGNIPAAIVRLQKLTQGPKFPESDRAAFQLGYDQFLLGQTEVALKQFTACEKDFPASPFAEAAAYWTGMADLQAKQTTDARTAWNALLTRYPQGAHRADASYQLARLLVTERHYDQALPALETFLHDYPQGPHRAEATVLIGDCHLALGDLEKGIAVLQTLPADTNENLLAYATFRIGAAHQALDEDEKAIATYQIFIHDHPQSNRVPEALARIGAIDRRDGHDEAARKLYWDAIAQYGDDPHSAADALFLGLTPLYSGTERDTLINQLETLSSESDHPTLAARAYWTEANLLAPSDPTRAHTLRVHGAAIALANPDAVPPTIAADFADALRESKKTNEARTIYERLLVADAEPARADAGIGLIAYQQGRDNEALAAFTEFEKLAPSRSCPSWAPVLTARAEIEIKEGRTTEAVADLERLLKVPGLRGEAAAATLAQLGGAYEKLGDPAKAIACFQRIYVMYGRWPNYVAEAYWQSGQAFEKLAKLDEAKATYREFVHRTDLASTEEFPLAKHRLAELDTPN